MDHSDNRRRVMGALGQAHGELYVEREDCREALESALAEVARLQEACGKHKAENARLRAEVVEECAKVADEEERRLVALMQKHPHVAGEFEGQSILVRHIAEAIRALKLS